MKLPSGRRIAAACIVAAGVCFICGIYSFGLSREDSTEKDYIQYWAAGQLLVHHGNPYDLAATLKIETLAGLREHDPKISVGPPIALVLFAPLAFLDPKIGLIVWLLTQMACLSVSIWLMWILLGKQASRVHLLGYLFPPALACLEAGQLGIFMLFGVVLFLFLHKFHPFFAGAALMPCALKPHLFLPFAIALLLWTISKRNFSTIAGFMGLLSITSALTLFIDRNIWLEYSALMHSARLMQIQLPTLSSHLRFLIAPNSVGIQYMPMLAATVWALWYWLTHQDRWNWLTHGQLVLLVSLLCAPYAWFTDEALLLPAMLVGVYRAVETRRSLIPIAIFSAVALIELFADLGITSWYYIWTTPAWFVWYLYATRRPQGEGEFRRQDTAIASL